MESYAKEICRHIRHLLNSEKELQGTIHSAFNRVCNVTFNNWPITSLIFDVLPMKPMAISFKASNITSLHDLEIERGNIVFYNNGKIEIPQAGFSLYLDNAKIYDCRPSFDFDKGNDSMIMKNINELRYFLQQGNPFGLLPVICCFERSICESGDIIPQNRYSKFAWPRIDKLIKSIKNGNLDEILSSTSQVAGFGPGLTPAADDLLVGLMISLIYASNYYNWQSEYVKAINSAILKGAKGKTTQLSYEIMSFASQGEVTENIHALLSCIYSNNNKSIYKNAMDVMNYGETSGSDLLTGVYIGCKIVA